MRDRRYRRGAVVHAFAALCTASLLLALAPAASGATDEACGATVTLEHLDTATQHCPPVQESIVLEPGREFAVPAPGTSVTFSVGVAAGSPETPEVTVARSDSLEIGVLIGEPGDPDASVYGSLEALDELGAFELSEAADEGVLDPASTSAKCDNDPYEINPWRWPVWKAYKWYYRTTGTLGGRDAMAAGLSAMANGTGACGTNVPNSAKHSYQGTTTVAADISSNGCGVADSTNVLDWGSLSDPSWLAATCTWKTSTEIYAADVRFSKSVPWHTSTSLAGCSGEYDLQALATHEAGHVFGLKHVAQASWQVMKPEFQKCEMGPRKLGAGDLRGMKVLFP